MRFDYEKVAEVTFGFWYKLSEDLYHANDDNRTVKFKPYIERLISAVCRHCQMEPDHVKPSASTFKIILISTISLF